MNVEIEIDAAQHDPAFCMFAGFRHIRSIAAGWRAFQQIVTAFKRCEDPGVAVSAMVREAAERSRLAETGASPPVFESYAGYVKLECPEGLEVELYRTAETTYCVRLAFGLDAKRMVRKLAQYMWESSEGELSSAAVAMTEIDNV